MTNLILQMDDNCQSILKGARAEILGCMPRASQNTYLPEWEGRLSGSTRVSFAAETSFGSPVFVKNDCFCPEHIGVAQDCPPLKL